MFVSFRARGLWGSVEGCQIRYQHIKTSLGGETVVEWHEFLCKTKSTLTQACEHMDTDKHYTQHTQSFLFYILQWCKIDTWAMPSLSFLFPLHRESHPHTLRNAQRSVDIKFSTYPRHASLRNHITSATPIRNKHNAAARSTLSNLWERHYIAPQNYVVPAQENNQKSTHPSREGIGYHFQFFLSSGTVTS